MKTLTDQRITDLTFLPTINKTIASSYTNKYKINDKNLMPREQKEWCIGSKGCKDQLLISTAILQKYNSRKKNVCMARRDYQKAFGSMPHNWIIQSLWLIGINNKIKAFTKKTMSYWKTSVCLCKEGKLKETEDIKIQLGIFQGDSLSPLLFCIAVEQVVLEHRTWPEMALSTQQLSHLPLLNILFLSQSQATTYYRDKRQETVTCSNSRHPPTNRWRFT